MLSCVWLFATPWTVTYQAPPSMGFSRQEYWSGLPFPSPGDLLTQGLNPGLPHCRQTLYHLSHQGVQRSGKTSEIRVFKSCVSTKACFIMDLAKLFFYSLYQTLCIKCACKFGLILLQDQYACSVSQSCPTVHDSMDCSPPGSFVCGIFHARILEQVNA